MEAPKVLMPLLPKPPVPPVHVERVATPSASPSLPVENGPRVLTLPPELPDRIASGEEVPPAVGFGSGLGRSGIADVLGTGDGHGSRVSVITEKAPAKSMRVSEGVLNGMLIAPIRPVYPAIARATRTEGTVIVEAVISKAGTIESLHVVSGPAMLQNAALEAIRMARYQPYRLNGEPTEVQTTITVHLALGWGEVRRL